MRKMKWLTLGLVPALALLLMGQSTGPTVFTPRLTVSPGPFTVSTGVSNVQDLVINGTCTGCVGAANFANPTGTIGLTAVNGAATTAIRSDGAPALSQAIAPTWSATHIFASSGAPTPAISLNSAAPSLRWMETDAAANNQWWDILPVAEQLNFRIRLDDNSNGAVYMAVDRTGGTTVDSVSLTGRTISAGNAFSSQGIQLGASGTGYGQVANNVVYTSSGSVFNYASSDTAAKIDFTSGGIALQTAPSGSAGTAITFTNRLAIEPDGSWNINSSNGNSGDLITSAGGSATPTWSPLETSGQFQTLETTGCSNTHSLLFAYRKIGTVVFLQVKASGDCTSDGSGFVQYASTNWPAALVPLTTLRIAIPWATCGGTVLQAVFQIGTTGSPLMDFRPTCAAASTLQFNGNLSQVVSYSVAFPSSPG